MSTIRELLQSLSSALRWWYVVSPWERSIRVRLGKYVTELGPGVHLRIPLLDKIYLQSVRRRVSMLGTMTLTTKDGVTITLSGQVGYSIGDVFQLYNTLHDAEDTIEAEARAALSEYVVTRPRAECSPGMLRHVRPDLERYGLTNVDLAITDYAIAPTFRLIQGGPRDYKLGAQLTTNAAERFDSGY